jgi:hypothetical protein
MTNEIFRIKLLVNFLVQKDLQPLNLDSSLETTDGSICMCHETTLETTGASDSFHYVYVKKGKFSRASDRVLKVRQSRCAGAWDGCHTTANGLFKVV